MKQKIVSNILDDTYSNYALTEPTLLSLFQNSSYFF
jgi:hypothetical protein